MPVGDVTSDAVGSGARYNDGKTPYDLLPLHDLHSSGLVGADGLPSRAQLTPLGALRVAADWQIGRATTKGLLLAIAGAGGLETFAGAARVFEYGRNKYAAWNWAKGMAWSIPLGCAIRHLLSEQSGEEFDAESGLPHRYHAICNALMLLVYERTYPQGDDRPLRYLCEPPEGHAQDAPAPIKAVVEEPVGGSYPTVLVGDVVTVMRGLSADEAEEVESFDGLPGFRNTWVSLMDGAIGKTGVVEDVAESGVVIAFNDGSSLGDFHYPPQVLVRGRPPQPHQPPAIIRDSGMTGRRSWR